MPFLLQVSRLVILHEEAEDGNAMPDLTLPVDAVSRAVANLVKVGRETINSSDDQILRQEMPGSLQRVNGASKLLEEACSMLKADPYSQPARKKLIEGARGNITHDTFTYTLSYCALFLVLILIDFHMPQDREKERKREEKVAAKYIHSNAVRLSFLCSWHKCFHSHLI